MKDVQYVNKFSVDIIYTIILLKSVAVSKLQVAILARSSWEMSETVRIDRKHILSIHHPVTSSRRLRSA